MLIDAGDEFNVNCKSSPSDKNLRSLGRISPRKFPEQTGLSKTKTKQWRWIILKQRGIEKNHTKYRCVLVFPTVNIPKADHGSFHKISKVKGALKLHLPKHSSQHHQIQERQACIRAYWQRNLSYKPTSKTWAIPPSGEQVSKSANFRAQQFTRDCFNPRSLWTQKSSDVQKYKFTFKNAGVAVDFSRENNKHDLRTGRSQVQLQYGCDVLSGETVLYSLALDELFLGLTGL